MELGTYSLAFTVQYCQLGGQYDAIKGILVEIGWGMDYIGSMIAILSLNCGYLKLFI